MKKKERFYEKIPKYLKDVRVELKKVTWPQKDQIVTSTFVVIIVVIILTVFVGILDLIFIQLLKMVTYRF